MNFNTKTSTRIECYGSNGDFTAFDCELPEKSVHYIAAMAAEMGKHNKIRAIKTVRTALGCGLRDGKMFVEDAMGNSFEVTYE